MLVQEALEAADATGTDLQQILAALRTCDFAPETPANAAFINFDMAHLEQLSKRLQGHVIAAKQQAAGQGTSGSSAVLIIVPTSLQNPSKQRFEVPFNVHTSYQALLHAIDELETDVCLNDVKYTLESKGVRVTEAKWNAMRSGSDSCEIEVNFKPPKPLSRFTNQEGLDLLLASNRRREDPFAFPKAAIDEAEALSQEVKALTGLSTIGELMQHLGTELALRCLRIQPQLQTKEYAKRELISPLLYTAAILAGELTIAAEARTDVPEATGRIDFVVLLKQYAISILEGKLHETLTQHEGQLLASMYSCREEYMRHQLRKRKRDEDVMKEVPSAGILSNGTGYLFYRCYHHGAQRLQCSPLMTVNLSESIQAKAAQKEARDVLATMIQLFKDQISAFEGFNAKLSTP